MITDSYYLNLGETALIRQQGSIHMLGLGSCVGLFLHDRMAKIAAAAHVVYPHHSEDMSPGSSALTALDHLLVQMTAAGANPGYLRAHIVGGAKLLNIVHSDIGRQNSLIIEAQLRNRCIYIATNATGEHAGRSASIHLPDGNIKYQTIHHHTNLNITPLSK